MDHPTFSQLYLSSWPYDAHGLEEQAAKAVQDLRRERSALLDREYNLRWWRNAVRLKDRPISRMEIRDEAVRFGRRDELDEGEYRVLEAALKDLKSWRKGPFEYAGIEIDAEWRSNLKWSRVTQLLSPEMRGRRIADVGCNNLYYLYRMLEHDPALVVGGEPVDRYFFYHYLNSKFYRDERIQFELFGIDDMRLYGPFFDLVFCMGILYHRRHPLLALENLAAGMRPGSVLILESAGIDDSEEICLFPGKRYMKAPGWWFLPSPSALKNMLVRSGFEQVEIAGVFAADIEEQRKTEWVDTQSLAHFLDPEDPKRTVEGYRAPVRIYAKGVKRP